MLSYIEFFSDCWSWSFIMLQCWSIWHKWHTDKNSPQFCGGQTKVPPLIYQPRQKFPYTIVTPDKSFPGHPFPFWKRIWAHKPSKFIGALILGSRWPYRFLGWDDKWRHYSWGFLYLYLLRNLIIMHWAVKWHKEHEDLTISVPGLSGLLMDRVCILILIVNTQFSPFNYI